MDIICIDENGLQFVLQDWNVHNGRQYGIEATCCISIKLINNVSDRQGVGLVLRYLLDCF